MMERPSKLSQEKEDLFVALTRPFIPDECPRAVITAAHPKRTLELRIATRSETTYTTPGIVSCNNFIEENVVCENCEIKQGLEIILQHALN